MTIRFSDANFKKTETPNVSRETNLTFVRVRRIIPSLVYLRQAGQIHEFPRAV